MNSSEFKRFLRKRGCTFEPAKGSQQIVHRGDRMSVISVHGSRKELGKGLVERVLRDLGLK